MTTYKTIKHFKQSKCGRCNVGNNQHKPSCKDKHLQYQVTKQHSKTINTGLTLQEAQNEIAQDIKKNPNCETYMLTFTKES